MDETGVESPKVSSELPQAKPEGLFSRLRRVFGKSPAEQQPTEEPAAA